MDNIKQTESNFFSIRTTRFNFLGEKETYHGYLMSSATGDIQIFDTDMPDLNLPPLDYLYHIAVFSKNPKLKDLLKQAYLAKIPILINGQVLQWSEYRTCFVEPTVVEDFQAEIIDITQFL